MLKRMRKNNASRAVVAAALIAFGAMTVTATPSIAMADNGHDPNGLYIFGISPMSVILFPFRVLAFVATARVAIFSSLVRQGYEGE